MDTAQMPSINLPSVDFKESLNWKKALLFLGSVSLIIFAWTFINSPMIVTVVGTGEVKVPASYATVSFSISATDSSAQNAITSVNNKAINIKEFLKNKGVAEEDIAQSQVVAIPAGLVNQGSQGYQAVVQMAAKTIHVSEVSSLISDLYVNGVEVVSQPVLSVDSKDDLDKQAFELALNDAKKQGRVVGLKNWKFIRKIVAITQSTSGSSSTATTKADAVMGMNDAIAAENGVFKITKAVSVSYKMW